MLGNEYACVQFSARCCTLLMQHRPPVRSVTNMNSAATRQLSLVLVLLFGFMRHCVRGKRVYLFLKKIQYTYKNPVNLLQFVKTIDGYLSAG